MTYSPYSSTITQTSFDTVEINLQFSITNVIYTINVQDLNLFISVYDPLGIKSELLPNGTLCIKPTHLH